MLAKTADENAGEEDMKGGPLHLSPMRMTLPLIESVLTTSMSKQGFTKFSVFLKRVSSLNPRVRTNFVAFPLERARKEPRSSVRHRIGLDVLWSTK